MSTLTSLLLKLPAQDLVLREAREGKGESFRGNYRARRQGLLKAAGSQRKTRKEQRLSCTATQRQAMLALSDRGSGLPACVPTRGVIGP